MSGEAEFKAFIVLKNNKQIEIGECTAGMKKFLDNLLVSRPRLTLTLPAPGGGLNDVHHFTIPTENINYINYIELKKEETNGN